jgi:hypothetical protein
MARGDTRALPHQEAGLELWDTWRHQSPPSPGGGSGATGHVAMAEPSRAERRGLAPWDTWQHRSPPVPGGGVWIHGTRGDARALPCWEAGLEPWDTWRH